MEVYGILFWAMGGLEVKKAKNHWSKGTHISSTNIAFLVAVGHWRVDLIKRLEIVWCNLIYGIHNQRSLPN